MCSANLVPEYDLPDPEWRPRPFVVVMEDDHDFRIKVRIPAAIGRHDAMSQARDLRPGYAALDATEAA